MARNDRGARCWSQPPHSIPSKSRSRRLGSEDLDDIGDIVNALSYRDKNSSKNNSWRMDKNHTSHRNFPSDCCFKNGLVHCQCLLSQENFPPKCYGKSNIPRDYIRNTLPYEKRSSWPHNNESNGALQENKMLEEFILDDNELCLLNYYDIPLKRRVRNSGKVKTVSIIDTLSELASGATDREDEGGFSSAVSESAVLNRYLHKPKARHARPVTSKVNNSHGIPSFVPVSSSSVCRSYSKIPDFSDKSVFRTSHNNSYSSDSGLPCSSLKRTLKYLRKAVASNVVEEENRNRGRHFRDHEGEAFRQCFSDSEVKETPVYHWAPLKHNAEFNPKGKSKSLLAVVNPYHQTPKTSAFVQSRTKASVPDWIQEAFAASKQGNVDKMKLSLKDIDPALVRNLSDDHGNNLWHICAVHNNFECLNWLCSHNPHHGEALKDENKNGYTPAALAVKYGSLLAVQWLIHNTVSKTQLLSQSNSQTLLHVAAKYGQYQIVEWLLSYMSSQDLDSSITDTEGNTALHLAAKYGHINCAKALIIHFGCLKLKNVHGLKPLELAVKHGKNECADFFAAMESCFNLASLNLRQHLDIQQLQKENSEIKNYFKELLTLTKRLQHRQKDLVQSSAKFNLSPSLSNAGEWSRDKNNMHLDDYSELLSTVMTEEEHRLLMVENKWKRSKKQVKLTEHKKKPLDVLRSQFNHVLCKVNARSPPLPSTPETSDGSWNSEDEENDFSDKRLPDLSHPDVINSLFPRTSVPYLDARPSHEKVFMPESGIKIRESNVKNNANMDTFFAKKSVSQASFSNNRDVNLRMFFKQNPNLRQSGETCSVLEVLEPSSSDGEEILNSKKRLGKSVPSEKEAEQSSSSSALETSCPYSRRPSSSGSKTSGSHSSNGGDRHNSLQPLSGDMHVDNNCQSENSINCEGTEDISTQNENKSSNHQMSIENFSPEPDLIKGTQKKKMLSPFAITSEKERKLSKDISSDSFLTDNPTTDSESLEADRSFSNVNEFSESLISTNTTVEPLTSGSPVKKKSFLFKFALRGKWQSKSSPRSIKNEISPAEFRETYSRTVVSDIPPPPSQFLSAVNSLPRKSLPKHNHDVIFANISEKTLSVSSERLNEFPVNDKVSTSIPPIRKGLLPPRRDPPPVPPINIEDEDQSQDHSDDDISISIQKSSISSCLEGSSHNSFLNSRSPDLWHSSNSKSHFRPASSASRVDSPSRDTFPLNKSSSASTEMLLALDSSTAGRQSPAPSEVSKTESALSPPSDVSKTESARYLHQLGKIEETAMKSNALHTTSTEEKCIKEAGSASKTELKIKKTKRSDSHKPWYEFSDEEDVIVPQRYQAVNVSMRSSSEDESAVTG